MKRSQSMPFGAEVREDGSVRFRLWAPKAERVELCLQNSEKTTIELRGGNAGWFELVTHKAGPGSRYMFRIDGKTEVPDPASRFQPMDVHGPSEVIDARFDWKDDAWPGRRWEEAVIYELHVGAFTPEGTFRALEQKLDYLGDLGVTGIELMPLSDFPGRRNWGYDGVFPYAPDSSYGRPEDLKHLVESAHEKGLMMFLDVVYNHFGPEGNYLRVYSPQFFTDRHHTPWGEAINFDGPQSRVVRDFVIHNAIYWLEEYHFDGLRLDAVEAILDDSEPDILTELAQAVRMKFGSERHVHLVLENGDNESRYLLRDGKNRVQLFNAQWNDDIHHAMHVLLTGESDGYYSDYKERALQQLCRCLTEGFAFQGSYSQFREANRGEPSAALPPTAFVSFLQNHDQIGNRAFGERIGQIAPAQAVKAAMEILLLAPEPPLLFMGEEFGAATPFLFFCDFQGDLASAVTHGRRNEFARFEKFSAPETRDRIPDPNSEETFLNSKLDWQSLTTEPRARWLKLYRELLSIRQRRIVPLLKQTSSAHVGRCESETRAVSIDWAFEDGSRLALRANLGDKTVAIERGLGKPLYASPSGSGDALQNPELPGWSVAWSLKSAT
jgi:malto-oligosyltrehalose trehalohydrolase